MRKHKKIFITTLIIISMIITGCGASSDNITNNIKTLIDKDLSDDVSIYECLYNEKVNSVYIRFFSFNRGDDNAIILLDDNNIFYGSVYSTIEEDDYDKVIEYGDYILYTYEISLENEDWVEIKIEE